MYIERAKKVWRGAEWIQGEGQFALHARCGVLTIQLYPTYSEALGAIKELDRLGCGGKCIEDHFIMEIHPTKEIYTCIYCSAEER